MDEITITYTHERGELLVRAWLLSKGEIRIHKILERRDGGGWTWLNVKNGVYVIPKNMKNWNNGVIEQWMCDLANSGVLNTPLAYECRKFAKRLTKAAARLDAS